MADLKYRTHVEQFERNVMPRHEPETQERQVRDSYEELRAPKVRGRESITLEVRLANGRCFGFSYAYFVGTEFIPGDAITVQFAESKVLITGRRLRDLFTRLNDHRVEAVQEGTETEEGLKPDDAAHIDEIKISN